MSLQRRMPSATSAWAQEIIYVLDRYKLGGMTSHNFLVREISRKVLRYDGGVEKIEYKRVYRVLRDKTHFFPLLKRFRNAGKRVVMEYEGGYNFPLNKKRRRWIALFDIDSDFAMKERESP